MDKWLLDIARQGHLILTVNDRLARYLSARYDLVQQQEGRLAWRRPEIMSLNAWVSMQAQLLPAAVRGLSKLQSQRVWETIIAEDMVQSRNSLLQVPQTALRAHQAYQSLVKYAADFSTGMCAEDHRAFLRWREGWLSLADRKGWRDEAEMPWLVAEAIEKKELQVPGKVIMAGFDDITPDFARLIKAMQGSACEVTEWHPEPCREASRVRVTAQDPTDEVRQCARWIRAQVEMDPQATIAVVVPQLETYRSLIENIFFAELEPGRLIAAEEAPVAFNLSLGQRLDREGSVYAALRLLRVGARLTMDEVSWLLRSPYLDHAAEECSARACLDRELRRKGLVEWSLQRLVKAVSSAVGKGQGGVRHFGKVLELLLADQRKRKRLMPGEWAEHFSRLLRAVGWPGDRGLSSREYQVVERFEKALADLASFDRVSAPLSRGATLKALTRLVGNAMFQPESTDGTIQVLGELEAAGMTFDHLWVLGLHDAALPQPPSPNPFIPLPVQRRYRMKRADAERERDFAEQVTSRLFSAAPDVVLSWPRQSGGCMQRPSQFILETSEGQAPLAGTSAPANIIRDTSQVLERVDDRQAPALVSKKPFSGGTGIIKDQALCPFRAYAHHRLKAQALDTPEIGIDNMSRGTLAHTVLELFWEETQDQRNLLALDGPELSVRLGHAADKALDRFEREKRADLPSRQRQLERERLIVLTDQWLEVEKQRGYFRIKEAEKTHQVAVGRLNIRTRIDRIDELEDGRLAIIDYKTGRPDPVQWVDDRVTEPQLPIYCLGLPDDMVAAVMFAVVRGKTKESVFRGLARDAELWPGKQEKMLNDLLEEKGWETFDDVLKHWREILPRLGDAFTRGEAAVDPVDPERACKYCDLTMLCRILGRQDGSLPHGGDDG